MPNQNSGYMKAYHCILDDALKSLPVSCFSIFYYIYRQTVGWKKFVDRISITQFMNATGIGRNCVIVSLAKLDEMGWIHVMRCETDGGKPFNQYSLGELVWKPNWREKQTNTHWREKQTNTHWREKQTNIGAKNKPKNPNIGANFKPTKDILKDTNKYIYGDLLSKLEFLPGVVDLGKKSDKDYFAYIQKFPVEKVEAVIVEAKRRVNLPPSDKDRLLRKSVLKFIAGGLENYDALYEPEKHQMEVEAEAKRVAHARARALKDNTDAEIARVRKEYEENGEHYSPGEIKRMVDECIRKLGDSSGSTGRQSSRTEHTWSNDSGSSPDTGGKAVS